MTKRSVKINVLHVNSNTLTTNSQFQSIIQRTGLSTEGCYLDKTPNSFTHFTGKCVATERRIADQIVLRPFFYLNPQLNQKQKQLQRQQREQRERKIETVNRRGSVFKTRATEIAREVILVVRWKGTRIEPWFCQRPRVAASHKLAMTTTRACWVS